MASRKLFDPTSFKDARTVFGQVATQAPSPPEGPCASKLHNAQQSVDSNSEKDIYRVHLHVINTGQNFSESSIEGHFSDLNQANSAAASLAESRWFPHECHDIYEVWHGKKDEVRIIQASTVHDKQLSCFVSACKFENDSEDDDKKDAKAGVNTQVEVDDTDWNEIQMDEAT